MQNWSKTEQQRYERRLRSICRLVKRLVIVQPVNCPPWCMCPWAVEEPLTSVLFSGTPVTEFWYDREAHRAAERRIKPPNLVAERQPPDAQGRDAVGKREQRAAETELVVAVQQQHNAVPSGAAICPAPALIRPHGRAKDVIHAVMSDDDI